MLVSDVLLFMLPPVPVPMPDEPTALEPVPLAPVALPMLLPVIPLCVPVLALELVVPGWLALFDGMGVLVPVCAWAVPAAKARQATAAAAMRLKEGVM